MSAYLRAAWAVYLKDLRSEARTRESLALVLVFAMLAAFIFNFAFDPNPRVLAAVGPGIVWVAYLFAGMLGLNRGFAQEKERGTLDGLLLAPVGRDALYAGKMLGTLTLLLTVEALMLPVFAALYDLPVLDARFVGLAALATVGYAAAGTLFSAISAHTRAREALLPLLFLPAALPLVIGAVAGTAAIFDGQGWSEYGKWIQLIAVYDVLLVGVSSLTFEYALED